MTTRICPIASARFSALKAETMQALGVSEFAEAASRYRGLAKTEELLRDEAIQLLFKAVPGLPKGPERYAALDLKRDLSRGKIPKIDEVVPFIRLIPEWWQSNNELADSLEALSEQIQTASDVGVSLIENALDTDEIGLSVALLSPHIFSDETMREVQDPMHRTSRTMASYLAHASQKTSPLSRLGVQAVATVNVGELEYSEPAEVSAWFEFEPRIENGIYRHKDTDVLRSVKIAKPNRVQRFPAWIRSKGIVASGDLGFRESFEDVQLYAHYLKVFDGRTHGEALELLSHEGMNEEDGRAWVRYLLDTELLRLDMPRYSDHQFNYTDPSALKSVLESAVGQTNPKKRAVAGQTITHQHDGKYPYGFENAFAPSTSITLPRSLGEDLAKAAQAIAVPNPMYIWSRDFLKNTYGEGCRVNLYDFLSESFASYSFAESGQNPSDILGVDPSQDLIDAPSFYTAFVQPLPAEDGGGFVLNRLSAGFVLGVRRCGDFEHEKIIQEWMKSEGGVDGKIYELALGDDWEMRQLPTGLAPLVSDTIEISRFTVHYDAGDGAIKVLNDKGQESFLLYTGSTPNSMLGGPAGQLSSLFQPNSLKTCDDYDLLSSTEAGVKSDRRKVGDLVFQRASWRLAADQVPKVDTDHTNYLLEWAQVVAKLQAPAQGYLYLYSDSYRLGQERKPYYYDISSLRVMAPIAAAIGRAPDCEVVLVEPLPSSPETGKTRFADFALLGAL